MTNEFVERAPDVCREARDRGIYDLHVELEKEIMEILRKVRIRQGCRAQIKIHIRDASLHAEPSLVDGMLVPSTTVNCDHGTALISNEPPVQRE